MNTSAVQSQFIVFASTDPRTLFSNFSRMTNLEKDRIVWPFLIDVVKELQKLTKGKGEFLPVTKQRWSVKETERFLSNYAHFSRNEGKFEFAKSALELCCHVEPENISHLLKLADVENCLGNTDQSLLLLEEAFSKSSNLNEKNRIEERLTRQFRKMGLVDRELALHLKRARQDRYPDHHLLQFWALVEESATDREIENIYLDIFAERKLRIISTVCFADYKRKKGDLNGGPYRDALRYLRRRFERNNVPRFAQFFYAKAMIQDDPSNEKNIRKLISILENRFAPFEGDDILEMAYLLEQARLDSRAVKLLEDGVQTHPENYKLWLHRSYQLAKVDDDGVKEQFISAFKTANFVDNARQAARVHEILGDLKTAQSILYKEVNQNVSQEGALRDLLRVTFKRGNLSFLKPLERKLLTASDMAHDENSDLLRFRALLGIFPNGEIWKESFLYPETVIEHILNQAIKVYSPTERAEIVLVTAGLGSGGAERQTAACAANLDNLAMGDRRTKLLCRNLNPLYNRDFYLRQIKSGKHSYEDFNNISRIERQTTINTLSWDEQNRIALLKSLPLDLATFAVDLYLSFIKDRPILVHAWQDTTCIAASLAAKLAGVPYVLLSTRSSRPIMKKRFRKYLKHSYRRLLEDDNVMMINNSAAGARDYEDWLGLPIGTVGVVYNGLNLDELRSGNATEQRSDIRKRLKIPISAPVVGGVMRMSEEKRPDWFIETAIEICNARKDAHIILLGDGPMHSSLSERVATENLADRIHLVGNQSPVGPWMRNMNILMLSSQIEGLPNVLIEAQSLGVPVASSNVGGVPEAMIDGKTGILLPSQDRALWPDLILRFLNEVTVSDIYSKTAYDFAENNFSMEAMVKKTNTVYESFDTKLSL